MKLTTRLENLALIIQVWSCIFIPSTTEGPGLVHLGVLRAKGLTSFLDHFRPTHFKQVRLDPKYRILESWVLESGLSW